MDRKDWEVSTTGGEKMNGYKAAEILGVSYPHLYKLIQRNEIKRAEARKPAFIRQSLVFFTADVIKLAIKYRTMTQEQADDFLQPKPIAAA